MIKSELSTMIFQIQKALSKSQGGDVYLDFTSLSGQAVRVHAFIAGGNIRPGSFRSTWTVDGTEMSKTNAAKAIR